MIVNKFSLVIFIVTNYDIPEKKEFITMAMINDVNFSDLYITPANELICGAEKPHMV